MNSKFLKTFLRIGISFGALGLVIYFMRDHLDEALHILKEDIVYSWVLGAFLVYGLANVLLGFRFRAVISAGGARLKLGEAIYLSYIGLFFNLFLPSAVGGDIAKGFYLYKHTGDKLVASSSVIVDRLMGFIVLMTIAMIAVIGVSKEIGEPRIAIVVYVFVGIMLSVVFILFNKTVARKFESWSRFIPSEKWRERILSFYQSMHGYQEHPLVMIKAMGYAFVAQVCFIMMHYVVARSLGESLNPLIFFAVVPVITIVTMAPSLGGLGVREAGSIFVFSQFMASEKAIALSLLLDVVIYGFALGSGILYALKGGLGQKLPATEESADLK